MITKKEYNLILNKFNATQKNYLCEKTIIELFEQQVERTPKNPAVVFGDKTINYTQLNYKANCLAIKLRELGVGADDFVALLVPRSIEMIIGIYGILKAGGAYVPIDPDYPNERKAFILEDCKPKAVLIYRTEIETNIPILNLEQQDIYKGNGENLSKISGMENLTYCIYTSGTTGIPKGVMNVNGGLVNRILWMQENFPLNENDVILQKTSYTFDVSFWELTWWGIVGAQVVLLPYGGEKDPSIIYNVIERKNVTTLHFVPSMLNAFLSYLSEYKKIFEFSSIKYLFSSGETININTVRNTFDMLSVTNKEFSLINLYGPTEASIDVTYYKCKSEMHNVPIGKPISNTQIYILDKNKLCGIGVPGEICIAGDGVARGYLNRPKLTKEKFVANPYGKGKMYRTGDLGRWLPDGNIEFLGRMDEQVKIRGCRVELGEIENQIRKIEFVKDCAVIAREDCNNEKAIYAYLVNDKGKELNISSIRNKLRKVLPEYMIPTYIGQIEKIPMTTNGKLDHRALPELNNVSNIEYVAPRNEIERTLVKVWKDILQVDKIGIDDNFFDIGGNSLSYIHAFYKSNELYPNTLNSVDLFSYNTIRNLANHILNAINSSDVNSPLYFIRFPDSYFDYNTKNEENITCDFTINGKTFDDMIMVLQNKNISINILLTSVYVYLLSDIANNDNIYLYFLKEKNKINVLNVDLSKISRIDDLFDIISNMEDDEKTLNLSNIGDLANKNNSYIIPLIACDDLVENEKDLQKKFDFIVIYSECEKFAKIKILYSMKIKKEKRFEFIKNYFNLFQGLIIEQLK